MTDTAACGERSPFVIGANRVPCEREPNHDGRHRWLGKWGDRGRVTRAYVEWEAEPVTTAVLPPVTFDPWDNRHVRFPLGLLATLLYMAERADDTGCVPECDGDPCSFCTAMQDAESVMNCYDVKVSGHD